MSKSSHRLELGENLLALLLFKCVYGVGVAVVEVVVLPQLEEIFTPALAVVVEQRIVRYLLPLA
jgi:hypothetical protein